MGRGKAVKLDELGRKLCPTCEIHKPLTEYSPSKKHAFGVSSLCKACMSTIKSSTYDLGYHRNWHLRTTYGLTEDDYNTLLAQQNFVCAICHNPETRRAGRTIRTKENKLMLHVDHDHATGKVRGLLCSSCNQALGLLGENPTRVLALLDYIKTHKGESHD